MADNVISLPLRADGPLHGARLSFKLAALRDLALQFPSLCTMPGIDPLMPRVLDEMLSSPSTPLIAQEAHAGRFVLHVWNPNARWRCGRFDSMAALQAWDEDHRLAYMQYVVDPFWLFLAEDASEPAPAR